MSSLPIEPVSLHTPRLLLRPWRDSDAEPFAALNADPVVMEHYPARLTRAESDAQMTRIAQRITENGWGLWAIEQPGVVPFVGYCGLSRVSFDAHFTPAVEIGWRLARPFWGQGYAREAASAALTFGFDTLVLDEIVSFTIPANVRSWRLMARLNMTRNPADDFDHPTLPEGHSMRPHVLYRKTHLQHNTGFLRDQQRAATNTDDNQLYTIHTQTQVRNLKDGYGEPYGTKVIVENPYS